MFKIKKEITSILQLLSPLFNEENLIKGKYKPVFLPFYHHISNEECDYLRPLYHFKNVTQFEKELDFFLKYYTPVDIETLLINENNGKTMEGKPLMHLSFDDGLKSCSEIIAPILLSKGIPASFFVSPEFSKGNSVFYRFKVAKIVSIISQDQLSNDLRKKLKQELLNNKKWLGSFIGSLLKLEYKDIALIDLLFNMANAKLSASEVYMNENDMQALVNKGFDVGAHSLDHPEYSKIDLNEQKRQTIESIDWVQEKFNPKLRLFSFPFTESGVQDSFFKWFFDENDPKVDIALGTAGLKHGNHKRLFQRVPMELYPNTVERRVMAEYMYHNLLSLFNLNKPIN